MGLLLLNLGIVLLTIGITFTHLSSLKIRTVRTAILLILTVIVLRPFIGTIRPQMFTYLGFAIIMSVIYKAELGKYGWLWITPPLIAVWGNLHGGFLAGLGILLIWGFTHLLHQRDAWKVIVLPLLFSGVATLINPYGSDLLLFLLRTATVARPEITDWQPLKITSLLGIIYLLVLTVSILGLVFSSKKRSFGMIIIFGILAILPIIAIRHLQLFSIGVIMISGEHVWHAWDRLRPKVERTRQISARMAGLPMFAAIIMILLYPPVFSEIPISEDDITYPTENVSLIKQSGITGNLAIEFNWGEYVIWHLGPHVKVSMDGRRETVYSDDIYRKHLNYYYGIGDWDSLLDEHKTDIALVDRSAATYNLLNLRSDWILIHEDAASALYVPKDSPLLKQLQDASTNIKSSVDEPIFP
jgi:hypothetical protein